MANLPLFLFTMLGGLAAGTYLAETCLQRDRGGSRPWLIPVVALCLLVAGGIASLFHVQNYAHLLSGGINLGSSMTHEVLLCGIFCVGLLADVVLAVAKKKSPFGLRAAVALVGVAFMVSMGLLYTTVYGNPVWSSFAATVLTFLFGDLLMGFALWAALSKASFGEGLAKGYSLAASVLFALALVLEMGAFSAAGEGMVPLAFALVAAPALGIALTLMAGRRPNAMLPLALCVAVVAGVGVARWAFYATSLL